MSAGNPPASRAASPQETDQAGAAPSEEKDAEMEDVQSEVKSENAGKAGDKAGEGGAEGNVEGAAGNSQELRKPKKRGRGRVSRKKADADVREDGEEAGSNASALDDNAEEEADDDEEEESREAETEMEIEVEDRKKREAIDKIAKIEEEFAKLKEELYKEKLQALKEEMDLIMSGAHSEFLEEDRRLAKQRDEKIQTSTRWKEFQLQNIENLFRSEAMQAESEYEFERAQVKERMLSDMHDKEKKLKDFKATVSIASEDSLGALGEARTGPATRQRRRINGDRNQESYPMVRKKMNAEMDFKLKESEAQEDVLLIKRGMPAQRQRRG